MSGDSTIQVWSQVEDGVEKIASMEDTGNTVTSVAVTPDGKHIITGGSDMLLKVWDGEYKVKEELIGHTESV